MFATRIKCVTIVCSVVIIGVVPGDGGDDDAFCVRRIKASITFKRFVRNSC